MTVETTRDVRPVGWGNEALRLLDQRLLPAEEVWNEYRDVEGVAEAISTMVVRGAPAIGCTAAFGMAIAARGAPTGPDEFRAHLARAAQILKAARPTAVNLAWAVDRVLERCEAALAEGSTAAGEVALKEALAITEADVQSCRAIGRHALEVVPEEARILTHCNAGALATAGYGTALGVVRAAAEAGRLVRIYADETRPRQQGARLTAWELHREGLPVVVIADTVAGSLMAQERINLVVVGADRIAANGDVANKIGTYPVAVLAEAHGIPFYVAAPLSTVDLGTPDGDSIPIEERDPDEVAVIDGSRVVPDGVVCENPAFDVTPARLVHGIITDRGIARPPYVSSLRGLCEAGVQ